MGNNDLIIGIGVGLLAGVCIVYLINIMKTPVNVIDNPQVQSQVINEVINEDKYNNNDYNDYNDIIYKNDEQWEIERDEDGTIKSLNIIRDVKVNK